MDPITSATRNLNLTYAGIYCIWTGSDVVHSPATTVSALTNDRPREPIKQGSAAWTSLRNNQHLPARSHSALITSPTPTLDKRLPDGEYTSVLEGINRERDGEHAGKIGTHRLPRSERVAQRRMILAVCGDGGAGEVDRWVS